MPTPANLSPSGGSGTGGYYSHGGATYLNGNFIGFQATSHSSNSGSGPISRPGQPTGVPGYDVTGSDFQAQQQAQAAQDAAQQAAQQAARQQAQQAALRDQQQSTYLIESPAPSDLENLRRFQESGGKVGGSIRYIGERVQGAFSKAEQRFAPKGQSLASTRIGSSDTGPISAVVQAAPYSVPYLGQGLLIVGGTETALNAKLPLSDRILGAGSVGLGAFGGALRVGKLAGFPKINTEFVTNEVSKVDNTLFSNTAAISRVDTLFGSKTYLTAAKTATRFNAGEDITQFESISGIATKPARINLPGGTPSFGGTRFGLSGSYGSIAERPLTVSADLGQGVKLSKELPGFETRAFTRTSVQPSKILKTVVDVEPKISNRFSIGLGVQPSENKILSTTASYLIKDTGEVARFGKGISRGTTNLLGDVESNIGTVVNKGSRSIPSTLTKTADLKQSVSDAAIKTAIEDTIRSVEGRSASAASNVGKAASVASRGLPTIVGGSGSRSSFAGTGLYERSSGSSSRALGTNAFIDLGLPKTGIIGTVGLIQSPRSIQRSANDNRNRTKTVQDTGSGLVEEQSNAQRNLLNQEQALLQRSEQTSRQSERNPVGFFGGAIAEFGILKSRKSVPKSRPVSRTAYTVLIKRRGRFTAVARGLPRGRALAFGADRTVRDLSRQFKVVQQGTTELPDIDFRPSENAFRTFKVRGSKRIPLDADTFIQKISATLQTPEEKRQIKQAKSQRRGLLYA